MPASVAKKPDCLQVPDPNLWLRYSSHFELPLAGMTSFFAHGLVLTAIILSSITFFVSRQEASRPPSMDVVMMGQGSSGDNQPEGAGSAPGLPGAGNDDAQTMPMSSQAAKLPEISAPPEFNAVASSNLSIPDPAPASENERKIDFDKIVQDANLQANKIEAKPATGVNAAKKPGIPGKGSGGEGGRGGTGGGIGTGSKGTGTGSGPNIPGGGTMTRAQIFGLALALDLVDSEGNGKEHADKLATIGMTVAFVSPDGSWNVVQDLKRRPVELKRENSDKYKDAVKWQNTQPQSIAALARELQLSFTPDKIIMMLPKDREEKIAQEEARYTQQHRRNFMTVRATHFDFRLRDGVYVPVVVRQE